MFEDLTIKFGKIVNNFIGKYKLSESNVNDILKKFRKTLLEADVSFDIIKLIISNVKKKLLVFDINKKISPGDIFLKVVNDEFVNILGGSSLNNNFFFKKKKKIDVILFAGLQGVGKTTSVIKLANYLKKRENKKVIVSSCDFYRPAAIDQLEFLSNKFCVDFNVFKCKSLYDSLEKILKYSVINNYDFLIIDSAGRLHIDKIMMEELSFINSYLDPSYFFLVVDCMIGQDGLLVAKNFCKSFDISGFFLTKMDSDARGGVMLSLNYFTKKPIIFLGFGENVNDIEIFYPDRIASRILGMGDISTLVENVNINLLNSKSDKKELDFLDNSFTLNDFKIQIENIFKIGGVKSIFTKLPGFGNMSSLLKSKIEDKFFNEMLYIIDSMTKRERIYPDIINSSRKRRISLGSGTSIQSVNKLLKNYNKLKKFFFKKSKKSKFFDFFKSKF